MKIMNNVLLRDDISMDIQEFDPRLDSAHSGLPVAVSSDVGVSGQPDAGVRIDGIDGVDDPDQTAQLVAFEVRENVGGVLLDSTTDEDVRVAATMNALILERQGFSKPDAVKAAVKAVLDQLRKAARLASAAVLV